MNLYVSNLPYSLMDEDLRIEFAAYGEVSSARLVKDRETGRSRGFGFVDMPLEADALAAINALNGKEVGGRALRVIEARPREERPPRKHEGDSRSKREPREGWGRDKRS